MNFDSCKVLESFQSRKKSFLQNWARFAHNIETDSLLYIFDYFFRFLKILKRWDSGCTICMPKRRKCLKNTTKLAFSLTTCFLLPQQVQPLVQLHQSENLDPFIMTPSSLYCYTCSSGFPHPWCISAVDNSYGEELHCYRSVSKLVMTD